MIRTRSHAARSRTLRSTTRLVLAGKGSTDYRSGTLVVCVLICLLVVSSLIGTATHSSLRLRRGIRMEHQMIQTELLLDAGILRAAKQLQISEDYQGETWQPSSEHVGFVAPLVEIRVTNQDDSATRSVEVIAQLGSPLENLERSNVSQTRRSRTFSIQLPDNSPSPATSQDSDSPSVE
jgi:hypothetical protein